MMYEQPIKLQYPSKNKKGEFIGKLFSIRDGLHLLHLKSNSYAEHVALNTAYDSILDLIDGIAEALQSEELLTIKIPACECNMDALSYVKESLKYIKENRNVCSDTWFQNEMDSIEKLLNSTIYKLKFLK